MRDRPFEEREYPEPDDEEDEDALETVPCPECGKEIYEELEQCPYCGEYVTHSTRTWSGWKMWFVVLAVLGMTAVVYALAFAPMQ